METITTDSINEFIQSKGGSVSVSELVTFLTGSKKIVCGNVLTVNGATEESTANKKTTCAPGEDSTPML